MIAAIVRPARLTVAVTALLLTVPSGPAWGGGACNVDSATATLEVALLRGTSVLSVDPLGAILLDGGDCDGGTVTSVDAIAVTGTRDSPEELVVDLHLPFQPGATSEPSGVSEIEIAVAFEDDPGDTLTIRGGAADEVLTAGIEGIHLSPDYDVDVVATGATIVRLAGGDGNDVLRGDGAGRHGRSDVWLTLEGGQGDDHLIGGDRADHLFGGGGDDAVEPSDGNDILDGGAGGDTVSYASAPAGVRVDLTTKTATGFSMVTNVEHITGSAHNDWLWGDAAANRISGGPGRDRISGDAETDVLMGGEGKDFFRPGPGDDVIVGGPGTDTLTLRAAPGRVRIDLGRGVAVGWGRTTLSSIENGVGSRFSDVIRGSKADNQRLVGSEGDDVISGLRGNDRIRGGPGDDALRGGPGDDDIIGGGGNDVLVGGPGRDALRDGSGRNVLRD